MTAQQRPCGNCGAHTRNNDRLCDRCAAKFEGALRGVPWLEGQLEIGLARYKAVSAFGGSRAASSPLPWHEGSARALRDLQLALSTWVKFCQDAHLAGFRRTPPANTPSAMAGWLVGCVRPLAALEQGPTAYAAIATATAAAQRAVFFKPEAREYLGRCDKEVRDENGLLILKACPGEVYAERGALNGICEQCRQPLGVATRKLRLEAELDDRLCTAAELSHMAVFLGLEAPRERVRKKVLYWHRHRLIEQRGTQPDTDFPTFRYGDVRALLYAEYTPREA